MKTRILIMLAAIFCVCFAQAQSGCIDESACNYSSDAVEDDGSCCYNTCIAIEMFDFFGDGWGGMEYVITDDATSDVVAQGSIDNAQNSDDPSFGTDIHCFEDGCYSFKFINVDIFEFDVMVTIWIGTDCIFDIIGGTNDFSFSYPIQVGDGCEDIIGCSDPTACNYVYYGCAEIIDDGSCILANGCTDDQACNFDPLAQCDNGTCEFTSCEGCLDPEACNFDETATLNGFCDYQCIGCMDEEACNYDETAVEAGECCYEDCATLVVGGGIFDMEIQWNLINLGTYETVQSGLDGSYSICMDPSTCYAFEMIDTFGDGWNGATYTVTQNDIILWQGSLDSAFEGDEVTFGTDYFISEGSDCDAGCVDPLANNYNEDAELPDNSCLYNFEGVVFDDLDGNGVFDGDDYPLPFREVTLMPENLVVITNDFGEFSFENINSTNQVAVATDEVYPWNTSLNPYPLNDHDFDEPLYLGISKDEPNFAICIDYYGAGFGYPCNDYVNHNICFRNMGNIPISGYVTVTYDEPFQGHQEVTAISDIVEDENGTTVFMDYENLMPGEMFFYDIKLLTPTVDYIGEYVSTTATAVGFYEDQQVAWGDSELVQEMTCSYDPNDKQGFPNGYADPHFVNPEEEIEYLVRFQNTGNAMANQVLIVDTLSENLDLESFSLMANSHSVLTTLDPETRIVEFLFENIMLPDSATDQEGSNGLVSYKIRALEGLEAGTEINNTAYIFFDNNPEIITNTTWHTIYECTAALATIDDSPITVCVNEPITWTNSQEYIENYNWLIQGELVGIMSSYTHSFDMPGTYTIDLSVDNPLCEAASSVIVTVLENPALEVSDDQEICLGESATFTASGEGNIIWNDEVEGEDFTVTPTVNEAYNVTIIDMNGCSSTSEVSIVVNELPEPDFNISENNTLTSTITGDSYQWYLNGNMIEGATSSSYEVTEDGDYSLEVTSEQGCIGVSDVMFVSFVSVSDIEGTQNIISIFPNPMVTETFVKFDCDAISQIRLVDASGSVVRIDNAPSNNGMNINKGELSSGWYLAEVYCEGKRIGVARLIVE